MKYKINLRGEPVMVSPEIKAAYNQYRLSFFHKAVKELDAKNGGNNQEAIKNQQEKSIPPTWAEGILQLLSSL